MKNRNFILAISLIIVIVLIILVNNNLKYKKQQEEQQGDIDRLFEENINQTLNAFSLNYNSMEKSDKEHFYFEVRAGLECARQLLTLTSYYEENRDLNNALYELDQYLIDNSPIVKEVDIDTNIVTYNYLLEMILDLNSEEKTKQFENYIMGLK